MATFTNLTNRLLLAGGFAVAIAAAPLVIAVSGPAGLALADECPATEALDTASGACKPIDDVAPPTTNPINPEGSQLQPGSMTEAVPGDVGELPTVDGIPCTGGNTGECMGLEISQGAPDNVQLAPVPVGVTP